MTDLGATASDAGPSMLSWVASLLWGTGSHVSIGPSRGDTGTGDRFVALPKARAPRLLVPATSTRAASAALRQFNDSMSVATRLRKVAAASAFRAGLGGRLRGEVVRITASRDAPEPPIRSLLADVFGRHDLELAISLGPRLRPNLKPVIQVSSTSGCVLGYVKVGWNPTTEALVRNESHALEVLRRRGPESFSFPALLFAGEWNGLSLSIVSPARHRLRPAGPRNRLPGLRVLREIASTSEIVPLPLSASLHAARIAERIHRSAAGSEPRERLRLALETTVSRAGSTPMLHGAAHGDLAPWNMATTSEGLFIWDWERWAAPVPVGLDVLHYLLQVALLVDRRPLDGAIASSMRGGRPALDALGVERAGHEALLRIYLIERVLRIVEGRADGVQVRDRLASDMLEFLERPEGRG